MFRLILVVLIISLINTNAFSQVRLGKGELRAIYSVKVVVDTTKPTQISTDTMFLEFSKTRSVFYNPARRIADSVAYMQLQKSMATKSTFNFGGVAGSLRKNSTVIVHQYPNDKKLTFYTQNLIGKSFMYEEEYPLFQWQMSDETQTIKGYLCKKATTTFRGRTWEVWYTLDIPTPFGVWKFYGLPGLVVLAKDSKNHYTFELLGLSRLPAGYEMKTHYEGEPIAFSKITHKKYMIELKKYVEDPIGYMSAALMNAPVQVELRDNQGKPQPRPKYPFNPIEYE
ncbi:MULTISPECIES: GLPGLI family protein [Raineya]|jgi:GLPGLI family protein|uniref:GLPGLI: GLPGLI family protein n=1 Tax=Raineya orbicola TaxID=2016530 RepID=A0A2N3IAV0_9BACT|nr:GLPGLI family protein [Raineya orbicola]PKQ67446.1 GLPGLI: GLPGLI family protein [Raineya orbicola]